MWPTWFTLALNDVRSQYRRTSLGIGWIVIGVLVFALVIGSMWSTIFGLPTEDVIPWITVGTVVWTAIMGAITGGPNVLTTNAGLIKTLTLPLAGYALWYVIRVGITFVISLCVALPVVIVLKRGMTAEILWLALTLPLLWVILFATALLLAITGARFRSLPELVRIMVLPLFLLTPVIWQPAQLGTSTRADVAQMNPLAHWIALVRDPILGASPAPLTWTIALGSLLIIGGAGFLLLGSTRQTLAYWAR